MANVRERAALAQLNALTKEVADAKKKAFGGKTEKRFGVQMHVLPSKAVQQNLKDLENKRKKASQKLDKERAMAKTTPKKKPVKAKKKPIPVKLAKKPTRRPRKR
jgi:hypothetical protein